MFFGCPSACVCVRVLRQPCCRLLVYALGAVLVAVSAGLLLLGGLVKYRFGGNLWKSSSNFL